MDILLTALILAAVAIALLAGPKKDLVTKKDLPMEQNQQPGTPSAQTATPSATPPPATAPTPVPPPKAKQSLVDIASFRYPNSSVKLEETNHLVLDSVDDSVAITDWYKQKIISAGANSKSFVTTKANDNVNNSLVGATSKFKISVKITKPSNFSTVSIDVTISSP